MVVRAVLAVLDLAIRRNCSVDDGLFEVFFLIAVHSVDCLLVMEVSDDDDDEKLGEAGFWFEGLRTRSYVQKLKMVMFMHSCNGRCGQGFLFV